MNRELLSTLFPFPVATSIAMPEMYTSSHPEEMELVKNARSIRKAEFAAGRNCAHQALDAIGAPPRRLFANANRLPTWPDGFIGSITHCHGFCAAVAGRTSDILSLGLDAEDSGPVSDGVRDLIVSPRELSRLARLATLRAPDLVKLVFCTKEAFYKAVFPLTSTYLDFLDVAVDISVTEVSGALMRGTARATILDASKSGGIADHETAMSWIVEGNRVYAGASMRRRGDRARVVPAP